MKTWYFVSVLTSLLALVCRYTAGQDGCPSPLPITTLVDGNHKTGVIPTIRATSGMLRPQVGGHFVTSWALFSASQIQQHGLWCQVRDEDNAGMGSNIGDFYYSTGDGPNGFTLAPTSANNSVPYVSLYCNNQIGLVVDGNVTNNQGIVMCNTTIPNLNRNANMWAVYTDTLFNNYNGPSVDPTMSFSLLSSRDAANIDFSFTFNVSFGPPSRIRCFFGSNSLLIIDARGINPSITREIIRSRYISTSEPDMTCVTVRLQSRPREERTYYCNVTVESRVNIRYGVYDHDLRGAGFSITTVTVAGTPTGITVNRPALTSATVSWTAPSPAPAGYEVFYQVSGEGSRISGGSISNTELTLTGLTLGETYSIFVVAYGAEGAPVLPSAHSNTTTITLSIPQLMSSTITPTSSSIMVSWASPEFAPDNYNISYSCQLLCGTPSTLGTQVVSDGGATNYLLASVVAGANCSVSVVAVFGSKSSNTVTFSTKTRSAAPTVAPDVLTNTSIQSRSLDVAWRAVPCPHQRGPITGYRLRYGIDTSIVNITGEGIRQHVLTGLTPFTNYILQVAAVNDGGTGPYSTPLTVQTLQDVPGPISGLSTTPEVLQLTLSWNIPSEPNGLITAYQIRYSTGGGFNYTNTSATQQTLKGFRPNTVVLFIVTAYTIIGPGESVTAEANTGIIPYVTDPGVQVINATAVRVSWTPVNLSVVDHYTIHYTLFRRGRQSESGRVNITAGSSSGVVGGLMTGEQYQFSVSVTVSGGGQYYTGPVSDPTDPVTVADTGIAIIPIIGAVVGVIALFLIVVVIIIVVITVLRSRKHPGKSSSYAVNKAVHYKRYEKPQIKDAVIMPSIEQFPESQTVDEGKMVMFSVKVSGSPPPSISWYHGNTQLRNDSAHEISDNGSLTIYVTEMKHAGVYRMVVTNISGSVEEQLKLTIVEATNPELLSSDWGQVPPTPPAKTRGGYHVSQFGEFVAQNHANTNKGFKALYSSLEMGDKEHSVTVALTPGNKHLNRFANIIVYDDNRIVLQPIRGRSDCQNDYINACYIDGYSLPNKYVAAQGPLNKTIVDFWRMIWQERLPTIVMVTNIREDNKTKCQQYWPDTGSQDYGPFRITTIEQQVYSDYVIRKLKLELPELSQKALSINQYQFISWPDHGVPDYATPILAFHRRVKQDCNSSGAMLVHCSAGVGRTGTFIALDIVLDQVESESVVDISGVINNMRHKRMKMVQTQDQFSFIHDAVLEYVVCGNTQINAGDLRSAMQLMQKKAPASGKTKFEVQFEVLSQETADPNHVRREVAHQYPNKNRSMEFLPPDRHRVTLKGEHPDYVHATYVNGYKHRKAFVIAQNPMENTVRDFLKMLVDRNCGAVVMICARDEKNACFQYWPTHNQEVHRSNDVSVELISEESYHGYMERCLKITLQSTTDPNQFTHHEVTQFHIQNWSAQGKCSDVLTITNVIEEMYRVQRKTGNNPVVVHCSDTVSRSGMFCAIATTIDQCKTEGVVDVFQVVKAQRIQKPGLVLTVEQYKFIFEAMLSFLDSFDSYSNFH